jgi:hypothetical protein
MSKNKQNVNVYEFTITSNDLNLFLNPLLILLSMLTDSSFALVLSLFLHIRNFHIALFRKFFNEVYVRTIKPDPNDARCIVKKQYIIDVIYTSIGFIVASSWFDVQTWFDCLLLISLVVYYVMRGFIILLVINNGDLKIACCKGSFIITDVVDDKNESRMRQKTNYCNELDVFDYLLKNYHIK